MPFRPAAAAWFTMRAENVGNLFYFASEQESEEYASINFQPNYFGSDYVSGSTSLVVIFTCPPA